MEKEKHILKGMREFVLMQNMHFANEEINLHQLQLLILKFAEFIGQKLEIWMFVPAKLVDGVWVVLEEPLKRDYNNVNINNSYFKEYQEAKDRVLFEGFEKDYDRIVKNNEIRIQFNDYSTYLNNSKTVISTIECLVKHNLELTPTAQKQIGYV